MTLRHCFSFDNSNKQNSLKVGRQKPEIASVNMTKWLHPQIQLLSRRDKPIFSSLAEQDNGCVTTGNAPGSRSISEEAGDVDMYQPVYDVAKLKSLVEHGVEEYNKTHPRIKLAPYRVRALPENNYPIKGVNSSNSLPDCFLHAALWCFPKRHLI